MAGTIKMNLLNLVRKILTTKIDFLTGTICKKNSIVTTFKNLLHHRKIITNDKTSKYVNRLLFSQSLEGGFNISAFNPNMSLIVGKRSMLNTKRTTALTGIFLLFHESRLTSISAHRRLKNINIFYRRFISKNLNNNNLYKSLALA